MCLNFIRDGTMSDLHDGCARVHTHTLEHTYTHMHTYIHTHTHTHVHTHA
jgi:hypothetical protein